MKILITGANGQLGLELQAQLGVDPNKYQIVATDYDTMDITNYEQVKTQILTHKPDVVINCAAYTAVDKCEDDIEDAYKINAIGPKNLSMVCECIGAKIVQISTDYVFSGKGSVAKREDEKAEPKSIYGSSKLLGEEYTKTFCKKYFIIRTAWLYGEGNNFIRTMLRLAETRNEINVVGDQIGSPTSTKDLARAIIALINTEYYGTFHATCEGQCSWYDFACKIFELKHIDIKVNKITTEEFKQVAKRPEYSVLDNFMLKLYGLNSFRHWEDAVKEYLEEQ